MISSSPENALNVYRGEHVSCLRITKLKNGSFDSFTKLRGKGFSQVEFSSFFFALLHLHY